MDDGSNHDCRADEKGSNHDRSTRAIGYSSSILWFGHFNQKPISASRLFAVHILLLIS
jgi:hypothetical protein